MKYLLFLLFILFAPTTIITVCQDLDYTDIWLPGGLSAKDDLDFTDIGLPQAASAYTLKFDTPTESATDTIKINYTKSDGSTDTVEAQVTNYAGTDPKLKAKKIANNLKTKSIAKGSPVDVVSSNEYVMVTENGKNKITGVSFDNKTKQKNNSITEATASGTMATCSAWINCGNIASGVDAFGDPSSVLVGVNGLLSDVSPSSGSSMKDVVEAMMASFGTETSSWVGQDADGDYWIIFLVPFKSEGNGYKRHISFGSTDISLDNRLVISSFYDVTVGSTYIADGDLVTVYAGSP